MINAAVFLYGGGEEEGDEISRTPGGDTFSFFCSACEL